MSESVQASTDDSTTIGSALSVTEQEKPQEQPKYPKFVNKWGLYISSTVFGIGAGSIWRFPYMLVKNKGADFLLIYLIFYVAMGASLLYLEFFLAQFTGRAPYSVSDCCRAFKGVGIASGLTSLILAAYIIGFIFSSASILLWKVSVATNSSDVLLDIDTHLLFKVNQSFVQEYGIGSFDSIWFFIISVIFWSSALICLYGMKACDRYIPWLFLKIGLYTFFFVSVVIILLRFLIIAVGINDFKDTMSFLFTPGGKTSFDLNTLADAAGQVLISLNLSLGPGIIFIQQNPECHNTTSRHAFIIVVVNLMTSLASGTITYCGIGALASQQNVTLKEIEETIYTPFSLLIAISQLLLRTQMENVTKKNTLFAFLLGMMMICMKTAFDLIYVTVSNIKQNFYFRPQRVIIVAFVCLVCCLISLIFGFQSRGLIFQLLDELTSQVIVILAFFEVAGALIIYGPRNLLIDIYFMRNYKLSYYWLFSWIFFAPFVFVFSIIAASYQMTVYYSKAPPQVIALSGILPLLTLVPLPTVAIYQLWYVDESDWTERLAAIWKPSYFYGPSDPSVREQWVLFKMKQRDLGPLPPTDSSTLDSYVRLLKISSFSNQLRSELESYGYSNIVDKNSQGNDSCENLVNKQNY